MLRKDKVKVICVMIFVAVIATLLLTSNQIVSVEAFSSGPPAGYSGAPGELTCATGGCHSGEPNTGPGQLVIEAPATYAPGETMQITVRHLTADQSRRRWGFQLTALDGSNERAGTLQTDGSLNILNNDGPGGNRQYIEHGLESSFSGRTGGVSWTFDWVAPDDNVGPVTLYAAGNQANNNGVPDGDQIYTATATVNPPSAGTPEISDASVSGKKLIVTGVNFDIGADIFMNGKKQKKTSNDAAEPSTIIIAKKAGKTIDRGSTVILEIRNLDGTFSTPFSFTRPL
jgi:hypothetical protein